MKVRNLLVTGLMVCTLGLNVACGAVKDAKNAKKMETQGNNIAREVNAEAASLKTEGIDVGWYSTYSSATVFDGKSAEKKAELRTRLTNLVMKLYRYIEIAKHKDMKLEGGTWKGEWMQENAMKYINLLDKTEGKAQTYQQHKLS